VRIACSTIPFTGFPLGDAYRRIRDLGFLWADLAVHHSPLWAHLPARDIKDDPGPASEALARAEASSGVKTAAISVNLEPFSSSDRGQFEGVCGLAARAGVPVVSVLPGERDEEMELHRLKDFLGVAAGHGLVLAVETYDPSVFRRPDVAARLAGETPGLKLTLDTGHLLSSGSAQDSWGPLYPHVGHVHVRDAGRERDMNQMPVGKGVLDMAALVNDLEKAGFVGTVSVEYLGPRPRDAVKFDVEAEIVKLREVLERGLRQILR